MVKKKYLKHRKAFRITDLENKALLIMCQQEGRSQSLMFRELLREGAIHRGINPLVSVEELNQIERE